MTMLPEGFLLSSAIISKSQHNWHDEKIKKKKNNNNNDKNPLTCIQHRFWSLVLHFDEIYVFGARDQTTTTHNMCD